jgi:hypothetical protein
MNRDQPQRPKDDPHDAPESGDKPEVQRPDDAPDAARSGSVPKRRTVEQQQPPAPPSRRKRDPEGSTAPEDNVSHAPEGGDRLEGGPLGR